MMKLKHTALIAAAALLLGCAATAPVRNTPPCRSDLLAALGNGAQADEDAGDAEPGDAPQSPNQTLLDAALEKCRTSTDLWEKGDIEGALEELDAAYILVLEIKKDEDPNILQQKEDLRFTIAKKILAIYTSRFNAANGYKKEIPLVLNAHVKKAIASFQGPERNSFLDAYRRSGRYRPFIVEELKKEGLPEELSWLPLIESGFKVKALSNARALGMWQFIASTGYKVGLERNEWIDERMDPLKSTKRAIAYLKELHSMFGDWSTALAAYNCGEGAVLKAIRTQKIDYLDNFWDLYKRLPCETASFYPRFLAVVHIVSAPAKFGFTLPEADKEIAVEEVSIDKQLHIETIARTIDVTFQDLKKLNPELRKDVTPPLPYAINVPAGKSKILLTKLSDIPLWVPPVPSYILHKLRPGDTVSSLALKYNTSEKGIFKMNRMRSDQLLIAGELLKIPTGRVRQAEEAKEPRHSTVVKDNMIEYVVKAGDTIWDIADNFNTSVRVIQSLNQLETTGLSAGQVLYVTENPDSLQKLKTVPYTVKKGDSPATIARRYKMKLKEFLRLNKLSKNSVLMPGQMLLIKAR